jgi:hypothetical protein
MRNPFRHHENHGHGDTMVAPRAPDNLAELLDQGHRAAMPDPGSVHVPDHPGELFRADSPAAAQDVPHPHHIRPGMDPDAGRDPGADEGTLWDPDD